MTDIDYDALTAHGAALLDSKSPTLWWREDGPVDLDTLDISTGDLCVTAQSVGNGDFGEGTAFLGIGGDSEEQVRCGFYLPNETFQALQREMSDAGGYPPSMREVYAPLTDAWKRLIQARRDAAAAQQ
jgi:hypothetical protein